MRPEGRPASCIMGIRLLLEQLTAELLRELELVSSRHNLPVSPE